MNAWWQRFGNLAQISQVCVAMLALVGILFQVNEIRSNNRATAARQAFLGFTDLAFKNPQFSSPDYEAIKKSSHNEQVQYESFVSYFLYSCEEAIAAFSDNSEWQASCDYDLKPHLPFLCEKNAREPTYLGTYSADTRRWILSTIQAAGLVAPECKIRKS